MWVWTDWQKYKNHSFDAIHLKVTWAMFTVSVLMEFTVRSCIYPYYRPLGHSSFPFPKSRFYGLMFQMQYPHHQQQQQQQQPTTTPK